MSCYLDEIISLEKDVNGKGLSELKLISLGYIYALTSSGIWKDGEVVIGVNQERLKSVVSEIQSYIDTVGKIK